ncbi:unnamed protein product [Rhizoctonia solani]|uniref:Uncharacterized protein n=1 Tax=Rhizoctonia solani TaxID=456999 RepID=A0A8H2X5D8_9AGAM|nr:unnamed protein product [Rhizoctonia solani]
MKQVGSMSLSSITGYPSNNNSSMSLTGGDDNAQSISASSDSTSSASSISLGVYQPDLPTQSETETEDGDMDEELVEGDGALVVAFESLTSGSPEQTARVERAMAELARYETARATMNAKVHRLWDLLREDIIESRDRYPSMADLHQANYQDRVHRMLTGCAREAGPAANSDVCNSRVGRILDGLYVPPIEEEIVEE